MKFSTLGVKNITLEPICLYSWFPSKSKVCFDNKERFQFIYKQSMENQAWQLTWLSVHLSADRGELV
jgi:hypothetical protein